MGERMKSQLKYLVVEDQDRRQLMVLEEHPLVLGQQRATSPGFELAGKVVGALIVCGLVAMAVL